MLTILQTKEENIQNNKHSKMVLNKLVTRIQLVKRLSEKGHMELLGHGLFKV